MARTVAHADGRSQGRDSQGMIRIGFELPDINKCHASLYTLQCTYLKKVRMASVCQLEASFVTTDQSVHLEKEELQRGQRTVRRSITIETCCSGRI
jgi:hypothetical protein